MPLAGVVAEDVIPGEIARDIEVDDKVAERVLGRIGPVDPASTLPPGAEYVWFKTDGAGLLLDILTGVA
jgi:hypothetical protein